MFGRPAWISERRGDGEHSQVGEIMIGVSLRPRPCQCYESRTEHGVYRPNLNEVIAKRLGISAGD
jgi:hypothetical protein